MNVRMRHLKSEHSLTYLFAREDTLYCHRHLLGKHLESSNLIIFHIEDVVDLTTRNDQRVTFYQRVDVEKSIKLFVLGTLEAG